MAVTYSTVESALESQLRISDAIKVIQEYSPKTRWLDGRMVGTSGALIIPIYVVKLLEAAASDSRSRSEAMKAAEDAIKTIHDNEASDAARKRDTARKQAENDRDDEIKRGKEAIREYEKTNEEKKKKRRELEEQYARLNWIDQRLQRDQHEAILSKISKEIADNSARIEATRKAESDATSKCEDRKRQIDDVYQSSMAKTNRDYREAKDQIDRMCRSQAESSSALLQDALDKAVSQDQLQALGSHCSSVRPSYDRFQTVDHESFTKPSDFYMGIAFRTGSNGNARRWLTGLNEGIYSADSAGHYRIEVPFVVDLAQGLQLIINPAGTDNEWVNEALRLLTIRLLMAYPAGKLQLTLIDPLKNGLSFAGVTNIVDQDHDYLIGGGVLTQREFIDQGVSALQLKMAGFSQSYGKDRDAYFKREAIQAIVINDFPNGFTHNTLENLAKIMKNGRDFGTIFVIGVNPAYIDDFTNDSNFKAIMGEIDSYSNDFMLSGEQNALTLTDVDVQLALGDGLLVAANEDRILEELRKGVLHSVSRKEAFDQLFEDLHDPNTWRRASSVGGVDIPIGVEGASNVVRISVGRPGTAHHGLITGATGSGKSTALHAMIMSTVINYSPDEVRLVLIDFKEGTEFRDYALYHIPSFLSITTTTEPEYALAALKDMEDEFERRAAEFVRGDIQEHRTQNPDAQAPRIILIFDEIQALFAESVRDDIRNACLAILTKLVTQGRSVGLHVFLASQNFERVPMIRPLMSDMNVRLCIKDTDTGGILENADALRDAPVGSAILNNGAGKMSAGQTLFQVCFLEDAERHELLAQLDDIHNSQEMLERYRIYDTRLLFSDIIDNPFHPFNRFIDDGKLPDAGSFPKLHLGSCLKLSGGENPYSLTGFDFAIDLMGNLLLVGNNSDIATSISLSIAQSAALEALARSRSFDRIDVYDFTEGDMFVNMASKRSTAKRATLSDACSTMPEVMYNIDTVEGFDGAPYTRRIDEVYSILEERQQAGTQGDASGSRILSIMYGIDLALGLMTGDTQDGGAFGELGCLPKLQSILKEGPRYGIHTVAWGQSIGAIDAVLNSNAAGASKNYFDCRAIFSATPAEFQELGACMELPATRQGAYFFSRRGRAYFRPFDLPTPNWVQAFGNRFVDEWSQSR